MRGLLLLLSLFVTISPGALAQHNFGKALTLDGDGDYVTVPDDPILNFGDTQDFTVSAWFRTAASSQGRLFFKLRDGQGYAIMLDYGSIRAFIWSPVFPFGAIELPAPPIGFPQPDPEDYYNDDRWHHVAFVRHGSDVTLYMDGKKVISGAATDTTLVNDAVLRIGADTAEPARFSLNGQIDEIRFWKVARSEQQIRSTLYDTLSAAYYAAPDSGLIAYYRFDEPEDLGVAGDGADDVRDLSLHGNHGDLVGDATLQPVYLLESFVKPRLVIRFSGMDEHVGEQLHLRVVDRLTKGEVAREKVDKIGSSSFEMWLDAMVVGRHYDVEFYADHNFNLKYDAPQIDHAWRVTFGPAAGNDTLRFAHNLRHTHIAWKELPTFLQYIAQWLGTIVTHTDTVDVAMNVNADFANQSVTGSYHTGDFFGLADSVQLYFSGPLTVEGDSFEVDLQQDSLITSGSRLSNMVLSKVSKALLYEANLKWANGGGFTAEQSFDLRGQSVDVSVTGTLGQTQGIFDFDSNFPGLSGTAKIVEDSVLMAVVTGVREAGPTSFDAGTTLSNSHPNPCDVSTTFTYVLPRTANVVVKVFDLLGREAARLPQGTQPPGEHAVTLNVSGLSSGVYGYSIEARLFEGVRTTRTNMFAVVR